MASPADAAVEPVAMKVSARFAKTGAARFHSHHDLMRFWERALRRAAWPLRRTAGFNPHPRLVFPHALGVGIASRVEEVEIELREWRAPAALAESLRPALAPTLSLVKLELLPPSRKGRQVTACVYETTGWPETVPDERLAAVAAELMAMPEWLVERGPPRERTRVDVRPFLAALAVGADGDGRRSVQVRLRHTAGGAGRVDEVVRALAGRLEVDAADIGMEKTAMALTG